MNQDELLRVTNPSRYTGGEINAIVKDPRNVRLKFALAFPDVYEVGMSHLGFQILYHILNQEPDIACERVFAPWPDMEKHLRERSYPLTSLESSRPLKDFDIIGFSLQYELNYTGVLNILDLAGIPLRASERGENHPLIIGGGPCVANPEPLADFFDAFVFGDGEEVVLEVCKEIMASRAEAEPKTILLARISRIEGVYIPSFFQVEYDADGRINKIIPQRDGYTGVRRRVLLDLDKGSFPERPILPYMVIIHDRLNIEIARGCTRGCRFCQAGMIYRPWRERSPEKIQQLVAGGLKNTGHDEVSLLSLSTGDYSGIEPLLNSIIDRYRQERIAVSLPSLRVETLTPALIQKIREVRKTGFTLAPEAGTDRLRRVINKSNTEEDLLNTIRTVFSANWNLVKLYFMIGLPTETDEDLKGIVSLCRKSLTEARRAKGSAQINVSISNFIPKPHTPFQWEGQNTLEEISRKQKYLRQNLGRQGLRLKWQDPQLSLLEGILARGDRRLSRVLQTAYALGSRLDGWGDHFQYDLWPKAFAAAGLDPAFYIRQRSLGEVLPWDHLDSRIDRKFLNADRDKAFQEISIPDCRRSACNGCGVCSGEDHLSNRMAQLKEIPAPNSGKIKEPTASPVVLRFRSQFAKWGTAKLLGHLELSRAMLRAFRRAQIPLVFSQGFHPLPKVSFGPPLPVGHESWAEFMDYQIKEGLQPGEVTSRLNNTLPSGIQIIKTQEISLKSPSIFDSILNVLYAIHFPSPEGGMEKRIIQIFQEEKPLFYWAKKNKYIDLKVLVESFTWADGQTLRLALRFAEGRSIRPEEILNLIFGWPEGERPLMAIQKLQVQFKE